MLALFFHSTVLADPSGALLFVARHAATNAGHHGWGTGERWILVSFVSFVSFVSWPGSSWKQQPSLQIDSEFLTRMAIPRHGALLWIKIRRDATLHLQQTLTLTSRCLLNQNL